MRNPNYDNETESGIITAVNADGSVAVKPDGCSVSRDPVPVEDGICFVGERVTVGFYYRERNLPFVKSKGRTGSRKRNPATSSLNWHNWKAALYRGAWNNTNILPDMSLAETTLYTHPNPEGTAPTFGSSKIHNGYVYGTIYIANMDNRLYRISLADGSITYATWTGISMYRHPDDLMLSEESGTLYAYIIYPWGNDFYLVKYNLDTMARTYIGSEVLFNTSRYNWRRLFSDDTYIYVFFYEGAFERYEYIRKYSRATGAFVAYSTIAWPSFDFQTDNNSNLCYAAEIRASIEPKSGSGISFPTYANQGTSAIIYEVPAIKLVDGTQAWDYKPTSIEIAKQYQAQVLYWYCSYMGFYGKTFEQTYTTTLIFVMSCDFGTTK